MVYIIIHSFDKRKLFNTRTLLQNYYYPIIDEQSSRSMLIRNKVLIDFCDSNFQAMKNQRCDVVLSLDVKTREELIDYLMSGKNSDEEIRRVLDSSFDGTIINRHLTYGSFFEEKILKNIQHLILFINDVTKFN